jgi:hypothetical protein
MTRTTLRQTRWPRWVPFAWAPVLAVGVAMLGGDLISASLPRPPLAITALAPHQPLPVVEPILAPGEDAAAAPRAEIPSLTGPVRPRLVVTSPPIVITVTMPRAGQ